MEAMTFLRRLLTTGGVIDALCRGWIIGELAGWATRTDHQLTSTVWALTAEDRIGARRAEGALERTNARLGGFGRQVLIAALAAWPKFKHFVLLADGWMASWTERLNIELSGSGPTGTRSA